MRPVGNLDKLMQTACQNFIYNLFSNLREIRLNASVS
jgi:hypothetical protein